MVDWKGMDLYGLQLSENYTDEERRLRDLIEKLPVPRFFDGWLFQFFKEVDDEGLFGIKDDAGTGFIKPNLLVISNDRKKLIEQGYVKTTVDYYIERLNYLLPLFHVKFKYEHDLSMGKFYSYCFLYLQGKINAAQLKDYKIVANGVNPQLLKESLNPDHSKLVQRLLVLIKDMGFNYKEFLEELEEKYNYGFIEDYVKTYRIVDDNKFEQNLSKIFKLLVSKYIHESIEMEQFEAVFSGNEELITPLMWLQSPNHLNYFLKHLKNRNKISNGNYFKMAEKLFVDIDGQPFRDLKNNHSLPKEALELDKIIDLF